MFSILTTVLKLFRFNPFIQIFLSFFCFFVLLVLISLRLAYLQGLTASFSNTTPHLIANFLEGETDSLEKTRDLEKFFFEKKEVESISPYLFGTKILKIQNAIFYLGGQNKFEAPVEILGMNLSLFPFVIPLELSQSLKNIDYQNFEGSLSV